jgi:TPR repeat protein
MVRLTRRLLVVILFAVGAVAQDTPAQLYDKAMNAFTGSGANRAPLNAVEYLRSAASKGHLPSQLALGYLYDTGSYVARMPSQAVDWYRKAAEQGDTLGQWALGRQYLEGQGVLRDLPTAERWLKPAAEKGDPFAEYMLGLAVLDRDRSAAVVWFRKAADQGLLQAQYRVALAYEEGRGISRDLSEAYVWMLLCSETGGRGGGTEQKLADYESSLGSTKVEALKIRVRELQRTVARSVNSHGCTGWEGEFDELPAVPPLETQKFCH